MAITFVVERKNLVQTHWVETELKALPGGAIRLAIDSFALTSNNITYAAFGEAMGYWRFFPTGDDSTGCIPVWGFGTVTESGCAGVEVGERFYGYLPMGSEVVLRPTRLSETGFTDGAEHRQALPGVYNQYQRCGTSSRSAQGLEGHEALLRPLFTTSFLIDDFLGDNGFFGATTVLLSSASSKTAYGTAFCLSRRRGAPSAVKIVGMTSAPNLAFTDGLGCYDQVIRYEDVSSLPRDVPTVYVDFSGSVPVRAAVHGHLQESLRYSCSVGGTHWEDLGSGKGLSGPKPTLFFAPDQIRKRIGDWGVAGWQRQLAGAWEAFMVPVSEGPRPWLRVVRGEGAAAVEAVYAALLSGTVKPEDGHVLRIHPTVSSPSVGSQAGRERTSFGELRP